MYLCNNQSNVVPNTISVGLPARTVIAHENHEAIGTKRCETIDGATWNSPQMPIDLMNKTTLVNSPGKNNKLKTDEFLL